MATTKKNIGLCVKNVLRKTKKKNKQEKQKKTKKEGETQLFFFTRNIKIEIKKIKQITSIMTNYTNCLTLEQMEYLDLFDNIPYKVVKKIVKMDDDTDFEVEIKDLPHDDYNKCSTSFKFTLEIDISDGCLPLMVEKHYCVIKEYDGSSPMAMFIGENLVEEEEEEEEEKEKQLNAVKTIIKYVYRYVFGYHEEADGYGRCDCGGGYNTNAGLYWHYEEDVYACLKCRDLAEEDDRHDICIDCYNRECECEEEEEEEEVRCVCPKCFAEGHTFVSKERAKELEEMEEMEEMCPFGEKCNGEEE
jgi:hypothetical protein